MEVVIKKRWEMVIKKVNTKKNIIKKKIEVVRLQNEIVISKIVFGMVHGQLNPRIPKKLPYTSSNYSALV
jgi:histone acetyltransferase (RNA polymerase elongator complex component)